MLQTIGPGPSGGGTRPFDQAGTMNEDRHRTAASGGYIYRRRYLDEVAWEPVSVDTVRRALSDVYHDVPLALDFLREAGTIRTAAATFEATAI